MVANFSNATVLKPPHKAGRRGGKALCASRNAVPNLPPKNYYSIG